MEAIGYEAGAPEVEAVVAAFDTSTMSAAELIDGMGYRCYAIARLSGSLPRSLAAADKYEARFAAQYPQAVAEEADRA